MQQEYQWFLSQVYHQHKVEEWESHNQNEKKIKMDLLCYNESYILEGRHWNDQTKHGVLV